MTGGVLASVQGGKFGHRFASAGFTMAASPMIGNAGGPMAQGTTAALVGGTASAMTGGKFANGAMTAAMSYAFGKMVGRGLSGTPESPPAESLGAGVEAHPRFMAEANLSLTREIFGILHQKGLFEGLGFEFINDAPFYGPDSWLFDARYIDETRYYTGFGKVRGMAYIYSGGIHVFRGGASSRQMALGTYAHEVLHFSPENANAAGSPEWVRTHGETFLRIERNVVNTAYRNWRRFADRHGIWPWA